MQDLLRSLTVDDYHFLVELIQSQVNLTDDHHLRVCLIAIQAEDAPETRRAMAEVLEREIRYLGSSELAYAARYLMGREPGVPVREVVDDVARALKVESLPLGTDRERVAALAERYATQQFAELSPKEQQRMLEELGVERERAEAFIKHSAGVFVVPLLVQAFGALVVEGLIKRVIVATIARLVGRQVAWRLFRFAASRVPWWVQWIGPAAWSLSLGWTALDLQGPALRKTIPVILYLGLCALRLDETPPEQAA